MRVFALAFSYSIIATTIPSASSECTAMKAGDVCVKRKSVKDAPRMRLAVERLCVYSRLLCLHMVLAKRFYLNRMT